MPGLLGSAGGGIDYVVEVGGPGTLAQSIQAVYFGGEVALVGVLAMQGEVNPMPLTPATRTTGDASLVLHTQCVISSGVSHNWGFLRW